MDRVLVLAGNFQQFQDFVRGKDREQFRYVSDLNSLRGFRDSYIIRIGTWPERHSWIDVDREIKLNGLKDLSEGHKKEGA